MKKKFSLWGLDNKDLTPDKERVIERSFTEYHVLREFDSDLQVNPNFFITDSPLRDKVDKNTKEYNALFYLAAFSDKRNLVEVNSKAFKEAMRFVEITDGEGIVNLIENMIRLRFIIIVHPNWGGNPSIMVNPYFFCFKNSFFEKDSIYFISIIAADAEFNTWGHYDEIEDLDESDEDFQQVKVREYVYLMSGWEGYTKIGKTSSVDARIKSHATSNPGAKLLFAIQGDGKTDGKLHNHFKDKRVKLEWFDLTEDDLQWIRENHEVVS